MIKHKTKNIRIYRSSDDSELSLEIDRVIKDMLDEINKKGHIFLDLTTTALTYGRDYDYYPKIIITVVYREVEKREVLVEKKKDD